MVLLSVIWWFCIECSIHSVPATREAEYLDHLQPPVQIAENILSKELQISSNIPTSPENDQPKREATLDQEGPQYSVVCTAPTYLNLGPVPPVLGSHFATLEGAESQSREASCIPGFVVSLLTSTHVLLSATIYGVMSFLNIRM